MAFIGGLSRGQASVLPPCIDDYVPEQSLARVVDAFVESLDLTELGFQRTIAAATGRSGFRPADMLRLYVWGYLNQMRSSRHLDGGRFLTRGLRAVKAEGALSILAFNILHAANTVRGAG